MTERDKHRVALSGATGFVGTRLRRAFKERGWEIFPLGRHDLQMETERLAEELNRFDAIVNLAGAPIIERWTGYYKKILYDSRINTTRKLVDACAMMADRPRVFVSTSAVGYYAAGDMTHTEEEYVQAGDFLGELSRDWEKEALGAGELGIRTVIFRFGVVLGRDGGALKKMIPPFRFGLGGRVGSGRQAVSWIHMEDLVRAILAAIGDPSFTGIYNLTAPNPTTNAGLTKALARALHRPAFLPVPGFVLKLQFGEGARVLTEGQRVLPKRLLDQGFDFRFTDIERAVQDCLESS